MTTIDLNHRKWASTIWLSIVTKMAIDEFLNVTNFTTFDDQILDNVWRVVANEIETEYPNRVVP